MQIYGFIYCLTVVLAVHVSGKTLFERRAKEEDPPSNLKHLHASVNTGEKAIYHREAPSEYEEDSDGQPSNYNAQKFINTKQSLTSKRSTDDRPHIRYHRGNKRRRSLYGVVYNQGRPIGILQPISQLYDLQDFPDSEVMKNGVVKRELDNRFFSEEEDGDFLTPDAAALSDDAQYPSKLTHRNQQSVKDTRITRNLAKPAEGNSKSKRDLSHEQLPLIEENLKQIIKELGMINEDKIRKREALTDSKQGLIGEDEDLEHGLNKIELTKEMHSVDRNKKENHPSKSETNEHPKSLQTNKNNAADLNNAETNLHGDKLKKNKVADFRGEGEKFIRKKRQQQNNSEHNDIVKGLEQSGDLTVSGNKSPLASSTDALTEAETKQMKTPKFERDEKRDKQAENMEYEKRLQRNIKNKIAKIKDDVKREIKNLKQQSEDDKNKRDENAPKKENNNKSRDKRYLLDKETASIRPDVTSNDALKSHVRKRRDALTDNQEPSDSEPSNDSRVTWREINDNEKSDIDKREEEPQKADTNSKIHNPHGYEFQRSKRNQNKAGAQRTKKNVAMVTSNSQQSGFQGIQNQIAAKAADTHATHAIVTRGSDHKNAHAASSDPKRVVEKKDEVVVQIGREGRSANSKQNARPFRQATGAANIEIELQKDESSLKDAKRENSEDDLGGEKYKTPTEIHTSKIAQTLSKPLSKDLKRSINTKMAAAAGKYKVYESSGNSKLNSLGKQDKVDSNIISTGESGVDFGKDDMSKEGEEDDPQDADAMDRGKRQNDLDSNKDMEVIGGKLGEGDGTLKRQERKSEPAISLEDMIKIDSENTMKRKRRQAGYVSRDYQKYPEPNNMQIKTYRNDEEEADDDSDEFDDDNFEDRSATLVRKRETYDEYDEPADDGPPMRVNKRNTPMRGYMSTVNADVYGSPNYLYGVDSSRKKRHTYENLAGLHSGGPMLRHFAAVRQRSMQPAATYRNKRLEIAPSEKKDQTIAGLSDSDIFGGLPQSYEGELNRFKRVKRDM